MMPLADTSGDRLLPILLGLRHGTIVAPTPDNLGAHKSRPRKECQRSGDRSRADAHRAGVRLRPRALLSEVFPTRCRLPVLATVWPGILATTLRRW
jgi:hypothetical protein